jgi:hypothetical protein
METKQKLFAFKLAVPQSAKPAGVESQDKWKAKEGVAVAGCTLYKLTGDYRFGSGISRDGGIYC